MKRGGGGSYEAFEFPLPAVWTVVTSDSYVQIGIKNFKIEKYHHLSDQDYRLLSKQSLLLEEQLLCMLRTPTIPFKIYCVCPYSPAYFAWLPFFSPGCTYSLTLTDNKMIISINIYIIYHIAFLYNIIHDNWYPPNIDCWFNRNHINNNKKN